MNNIQAKKPRAVKIVTVAELGGRIEQAVDNLSKKITARMEDKTLIIFDRQFTVDETETGYQIGKKKIVGTVAKIEQILLNLALKSPRVKRADPRIEVLQMFGQPERRAVGKGKGSMVVEVHGCEIRSSLKKGRAALILSVPSDKLQNLASAISKGMEANLE